MAVTGEIKKTTVEFSDFGKYENQIVTIKGTVHNIRMMSDFAFVILRTARETVQVLLDVLEEITFGVSTIDAK